MKQGYLGVLLVALLSTGASAQSVASDSFNDRFAAAKQRTAAFEPTKEMAPVQTGPSNYVHPLDRVIAQRLTDVRAYLHTGGSLDDLLFTWTVSVWKWPVISAELDDEPSAEPAKKPSPEAVAATTPQQPTD